MSKKKKSSFIPLKNPDFTIITGKEGIDILNKAIEEAINKKHKNETGK